MTPHAPQNNGWMDPDPKGMWFHGGEVEALESGFAKLEAENAELRKRYLHVSELNHNQVSMVRAYSTKADIAVRWKRCFQITFSLKNKYRRDLAAANATLDRLREVVPDTFTTENSHIWRKSLYKVRAILYPTPENDNEQI